MDGAAEFVRGDAIAGLLITFINLAGRLIIGVGQMGVSFAQAGHSYHASDVGYCLVFQVPALVVSTMAGLLVAKTGVSDRTDRALFGQFSAHQRARHDQRPARAARKPAWPAIPAIPAAVGDQRGWLASRARAVAGDRRRGGGRGRSPGRGAGRHRARHGAA
jgi:flagellar biosynthesis protein FlhA